MRVRLRVAISRSLLLTLAFVICSNLAAAQGRNTIEGRVVGSNGQPIENARVSLKNTVYSDVGQAVTDIGGYYRFDSVGSGVYYIEVEPVGTWYGRKTQRIEIVSLRSGGSADNYQVDFQLPSLRPVEKPLPKKLADSLLFVQEIPPAALQKYKEGQKLLEKDKKEEAFAALRQAIEIFPDYYDALDLLGTEYLNAGWHDVAVPLFLQAVDVNKKGWHSYYGLGSAYSGLRMSKKAIEALNKSIEMNPLNARTFLRLGGEYAKEKSTLNDAIKAFQEAVKVDAAAAPEAYVGLANIYSQLGRYHEAADALEEYLKVAPDVKNASAIERKIKELRRKTQNNSAPTS
jgi:tetratricopeptide (TPR) repeat protein